MSYTEPYNLFIKDKIDYYTYLSRLYNVIINDKNSENDSIREKSVRIAIEKGPEEIPEDQEINKELQEKYDNNDSAEDILGHAINNRYGEGYFYNNGYHQEGGYRRVLA